MLRMNVPARDLSVRRRARVLRAQSLVASSVRSDVGRRARRACRGHAHVAASRWGSAWRPLHTHPLGRPDASPARADDRSTIGGRGCDFRSYLAITGGRDYWHVHAVAVDPEHHGTGIGSALVSHGMGELARLRGDAAVPVVLSTQRERNLPLFRRAGFELLNRQKMGSKSRPFEAGSCAWFEVILCGLSKSHAEPANFDDSFFEAAAVRNREASRTASWSASFVACFAFRER